MNHLVFISYSSRDGNRAQQVLKTLESRNIPCWIAPRNIIGGMEYGDVIDNAINTCKAMVVIFSKSSNNSQWVKGELNLAFSEGKAIIPYKIDDTALNGAMRLMLNDKHWINAYDSTDLKLDELIKAVEVALQIPLSESLGTNNPPIAPKKKTGKALPLALAAGIVALGAVGAFFGLSKSKTAQQSYVKQYENLIQKADSLVNTNESNYTSAWAKYQEAAAIEENIPQESRKDLQEKTIALQNRMDSLFFRLVNDGDFFAELDTEHGMKQAVGRYEQALQLKESELIRMKLNKLKANME